MRTPREPVIGLSKATVEVAKQGPEIILLKGDPCPDVTWTARDLQRFLDAHPAAVSREKAEQALARLGRSLAYETDDELPVAVDAKAGREGNGGEVL